MQEENSKFYEDGQYDLAIDPDVLAEELAAEVEGDPLDEIDLDTLDSDRVRVATECEMGLKWLQQGHEERLQGLRVFCEHRDPRALPLLIPLLSEPCPVERMSAVYALGRNPSPSAVKILLELLQTDGNAYVRKAAAWSLGNYSNAPVMEPLVKALRNDVAAVRLWAASSLAEVGSNASVDANVIAPELLLSLQIDQEPIVRSNCIWALGRLYDFLSEELKNELVDLFISILLNDLEPSVRYECKISLEQIDNPLVQDRLKSLVDQGFLT